MTIQNLILSFSILLFTTCSQSNNKTNVSTSKDSISPKIPTNYKADHKQISAFNWIQLKDTTKYNLVYLQINFFDFPDSSSIGQDILKFAGSTSNNSYLLTNGQEFLLYKLINDKTNFSKGECGTFHLNAGILVIKKNKICGTINIGCSYTQLNFSSTNPKSKNGALNETGVSKLQRLLDDINLNKIN